MNKLYMLVGLPCSGKTTFREIHFPRTEYEHISSDDTIERNATMLNMKYFEIFPDLIDFAEKINRIKAEQAVKKQHSVVWDQTNLTVKSRAKKLALFPETYYKIAYIFNQPSEEVLKERLNEAYRKHNKMIPELVLERMIKSFEYPIQDEGFSEIRNIL